MSGEQQGESRRSDASRSDPKRREFSRSYDVQQLVERFAKATTGEVLPYAEIEAIAGGPHRDAKISGRIQSARKIIQREKAIVFGVVRGVGLQRMADGEIVSSGSESIARIRRESVRGAKRLACAKYETLSPAEQRKHDAAASHLMVIAEFSRPATVKAIASKTDVENKRLTLDETLAAFRKK